MQSTKSINVIHHSNNLISCNSNMSVDIVIKFNPSIYESIKDELDKILKLKSLSRSGVYIIDRSSGFYIGESQDVLKRIGEHLTNLGDDIKWITFAIAKHQIDEMNKEETRDIEAVLIDSAEAMGVELKNIKPEKRKVKNIISKSMNLSRAEYIWDKFRYLNIISLIDAYQSTKIIDSLQEKSNELKQTTMDTSIIKKEWNKDSVIRNVNMMKSKNLSDCEIFKFVDYRDTPTKGYQKESIEIFQKEYAKKSLLLYLWESKGGHKVDAILTNGVRPKGYLSQPTLSYYHINSAGINKGILQKNNVSKEHAIKMIDELVEKNCDFE